MAEKKKVVGGKKVAVKKGGKKKDEIKFKTLTDCILTMKETFDEVEMNTEKFDEGQGVKAAGSRVRKGLQAIRKMAQVGRKMVTEIKAKL